MSLASRFNKDSKTASKKSEICVSKLDANGLEKYLNRVLEEVKTSVAKDGENAVKKSLARHRLSRSQLENQESLQLSSVDGIYRSLFVHSTCFAGFVAYKDSEGKVTTEYMDRVCPTLSSVDEKDFFGKYCGVSDDFAEIFLQFNEQIERLQSLENTQQDLLEEKEELESKISTLEERLAEEQHERLRLKTENNDLKEEVRIQTMSAEQLMTKYKEEVTERVAVEGALRACKDKAQELTESEQNLKNHIERLLDEKVNMESKIASTTEKAKHIINAVRLEDEAEQASALETDYEERSVFESGVDSDLDAIDCTLKNVNALWDKYSAKVQQVEELQCALQAAKDGAFLQKIELAKLRFSSAEENTT